jgi:hypothetical protein
VGRVHTGKQDLSDLVLRKMKGFKKPRSASRAARRCAFEHRTERWRRAAEEEAGDAGVTPPADPANPRKKAKKAKPGAAAAAEEST